MNIVSHITFTVLILYVSIGVYVLGLDFKGKLNRIFFFLFMSLSLWSLGTLFILHPKTSSDAWFWYRIAFFGQSFFPIAVLCFFAVLTKSDHFLKKQWFALALYFIPFIFIFRFLTGPVIVKDIWVPAPGIVKFTFDHGFWFFSFLIYEVFCAVTSIVMMLIWRCRLKYPNEKRQMLIIIFSTMTTFIAAIIVGIYLPDFYSSEAILLTPCTMFFAAAGIWYAVVKYRLMVMTPSLAAESILDTIVDSVVLTDKDLKMITINKETCKLLGFKEKELLGKDIEVLFGNDELFSRTEFMNLLNKESVRNYEKQYITKDGRYIPVVFSASEHKDRYGNLIGIVIIAKDITEQKMTEERLKHLAHHDFLTGLPNRLLFSDRLKQSLVAAQRHSRLSAIILIDIDHFKEVNDDLGHEKGDILLVQIAHRLRASVRKTDTISRFGGDEFVIIINELLCIADIHEVAGKISGAFSAPFDVGVKILNVTPSIGISVYPFDGNDAETLMKNADLAMYYVKTNGRNNYQLYSEVTNAKKASPDTAAAACNSKEPHEVLNHTTQLQ